MRWLTTRVEKRMMAEKESHAMSTVEIRVGVNVSGLFFCAGKS